MVRCVIGVQIKAVVNNNTVMSMDTNGDECVIIGRGLGFQAKAGDPIDEKLVQKKFFIADKGIMAKFHRIIDDVTSEELLITSEIISMAKRKLQVNLNESIYISLTDHIHYVIKRYHAGQEIKNSFLWDIKRYYPSEFSVASDAVKMINSQFEIDLSEDEAGFITFHFINAANNLDETDNTGQLTEIVHEIINVVSLSLNMVIESTDLNSYRFITHVKFFAQRMIKHIDNSDDSENDLYNLVKQKYVLAYQVMIKLDRFLVAKYNYQMSKNDKLYFMIHIHRLTKQISSE